MLEFSLVGFADSLFGLELLLMEGELLAVKVGEVVQLPSLLFEAVEALEAVFDLNTIAELFFEFLDDEGGSPEGAPFASYDVAVNMVADVENLFSFALHKVFKVPRVASLIDAALLQTFDTTLRGGEVLIQFGDGLLLGEEAGFAGPDEDDVKVVSPVGIFGEEVVEDVGHHGVGVFTERVGQQK